MTKRCPRRDPHSCTLGRHLDPPKAVRIAETDFQRQVTDLAERLGWSWVHFRPARTEHGWRTPVQGPLGKGWPDLVLVHPRQRRLVLAELKADDARPGPAQTAVLGVLAAAGVETYLWRPSDLEAIAAVLA